MSPNPPECENNCKQVCTSHHSRSIWQVIWHGMLAFLIYVGIGLFVFQTWMIEASRDVRTAQPMGFTFAVCLIGLAFFSIIERRTILQIFICGFIGILVGWIPFPSTSMRPESRFQAIESGAWYHFYPFAICFGTFVGTLLAQNLDAIRQLIAKVNDASPTIATRNPGAKH
jgi:hypothetical protein